MTTYKLTQIESMNGSEASLLLMETNGIVSHVPIDESNPDYQAYLAYLAEKESK